MPRVRLRVGRLSGVVPDAVRFCFDLVTEGTLAEGAALEIEEPAGRGACRTCGRPTSTCATGAPLCECGSADVEVAGRARAAGLVEVEVA